MAISLKDLRKTRNDRPACILLYGPEKVGKTTLANEFPNAVFVQTEEGAGTNELDTFGLLTTYPDVMDALYSLLTEDHGYGTVIVDSVTALQALVWAETGERGDEKGNKKKRIEDFGYGKGYKYADVVWLEFLGLLKELRAKGLTIVMIGHSTTERFDDPETVSYTRYEIDLHERARDLLKRESDAIILVKADVSIKDEDQGFNRTRAIAAGGRTIWMHTSSRPAYAAGNRFGMPEKIQYEPGKGFSVLAPWLPGLSQNEAAQAA